MIENRDQVMERLERVRDGASTEWVIGKDEAWLILECFKRDHERMIELEETLVKIDDDTAAALKVQEDVTLRLSAIQRGVLGTRHAISR